MMTGTNINLTPAGEVFTIDINGLKISPGKKMFKQMQKWCDRVMDETYRQDTCLINEGYEGSGKTNAALVEAVLLHYLTNFPINLFFKTSDAMNFLKSTEKQIVILDEPSLESLSSDTKDNLNRDFLRLVSTMRKKRHILIINFAKFWKFPEFLVVDRPLALIYMSGMKRSNIGDFDFIPKEHLEQLWKDKKDRKKLSYKKLRVFRGHFTYMMEEIFEKFDIRIDGKPHATYNDYEDLKDEAISTIGVEKTDDKKKLKLELRELKYKIGQMKPIELTNKMKIANYFGINRFMLKDWANFGVGGNKNLLKRDIGDDFDPADEHKVEDSS